MFDGVHAADARAIRHAQSLVARAGALDVGNRSGHLPVRGSQDAPVRSGGSEQAFHHHAADHVAKFPCAVFLLGIQWGGLEASRQHDTAGFDFHRFGLLGKVNRVRGASLDALAAEDAVLNIHNRLLRYGGAERHINDAARGAPKFVFVFGYFERTDQLAGTTARAIVFAHVARLFGDLHSEPVPVAVDGFNFGVGQQVDIVMMRRGGHFWGGDAGTTVERGEDLAQVNHLPADAGLALHQRDLVALVAQIERGLHSSNPAADHQRIHFDVIR